MRDGSAEEAGPFYFGVAMLYRKKILVSLFFILLAGCYSKHASYRMMNDQINVFGVQLFSKIDYREINGVSATEEPCLRGYERSFDALDVIIGYGFDKKIRKITTRNKSTSMFGIKPGMTFEEGKKKLLQAGFHEHATPFTFRASGCSLIVLVDSNNTIFGLTLESLD